MQREKGENTKAENNLLRIRKTLLSPKRLHEGPRAKD